MRSTIVLVVIGFGFSGCGVATVETEDEEREVAYKKKDGGVASDSMTPPDSMASPSCWITGCDPGWFCTDDMYQCSMYNNCGREKSVCRRAIPRTWEGKALRTVCYHNDGTAGDLIVAHLAPNDFGEVIYEMKCDGTSTCVEGEFTCQPLCRTLTRTFDGDFDDYVANCQCEHIGAAPGTPLCMNTAQATFNFQPGSAQWVRDVGTGAVYRFQCCPRL